MKRLFTAIAVLLCLTACTPPDFPDTPTVNSDYKAPETTKPDIFNTEKNEGFSSVEGYTKLTEITFTTGSAINWDDLVVVPETEAPATPKYETVPTGETSYEEEIEIDLDDEWVLYEEETETETAATYETVPPPDLSDDPEASLPDD
ncbi:MAG: hypothetical protein LBL87_07495 [Ruminococcus sp.]|jgi:hypothetical protein|nr:hypothetical protein [Ruminococcus sp.]